MDLSAEIKKTNLRNTIVIALWSAVLIAICIRVGLVVRHHDVFATYADAGRKWIAAEPLYSYTRGFVYSPLIAALFSPWALLPDWLGAIIWRLLTTAIFVVGIFYWLKEELEIPRSNYWLVFLLILPLSIGNFNNGQVNPLIIGLLMVAIVAARQSQWTISVICLSLCAYLKIYPLAVGLLLLLVYPRQLGWRLALVLFLMGAFSFFLQQPAYVLDQYKRWIGTRATDDRRMNMDIAPRDFAMLLRAIHVDLSSRTFLVLQLSAAVAAAAVCIYGRLKKWSKECLLLAVLNLGTCWMLLFGPATEDATYVMIAPPLALALVRTRKTSTRMRFLLYLSYLVLLTGFSINSFLRLKKNPYNMSVQPLGALLFLIYTLIWLFISPRAGVRSAKDTVRQER
jgi:Glycosyltransferase family 87